MRPSILFLPSISNCLLCNIRLSARGISFMWVAHLTSCSLCSCMDSGSRGRVCEFVVSGEEGVWDSVGRRLRAKCCLVCSFRRPWRAMRYYSSGGCGLERDGMVAMAVVVLNLSGDSSGKDGQKSRSSECKLWETRYWCGCLLPGNLILY